jgi:hypothetical protein
MNIQTNSDFILGSARCRHCLMSLRLEAVVLELTAAVVLRECWLLSV